ncbi:hypothetical protein [Ignatzschineria sp. LJL83]
MWAIFVIFMLVCGYMYVDADLPSKYKLKKSIGWNSYFLVAVKGAEFVLKGGIISVIIISSIYILMFLLNLLTYAFGWYEPFSFAYWLMGQTFLELRVPFIIWGIITLMISKMESEGLREYYKKPENRIKGFRKIAESNAVEAIILESLDNMKNGVLLFVTLKSRKVYIGVVDGVRFESGDTSDLVLVPFISGYREKETLTFYKEHDYSKIYNEMGMWSGNGPLTIQQFRIVIPMGEIEALSLFHLDVYDKFQDKKRAMTLE